MDHAQAVEIKATERYLLDDMSPETREEFEEHLFDCAECTLDLRAAAAFVDEATLQLPGLLAADEVAAAPVPAAPVPLAPAPAPQRIPVVDKKSRDWFGWLRAAFAVPVFAALLLVIAYQNIAVIPALHLAASQPSLMPWTTLHSGTRAGGHTPVAAQRSRGAVLLVDLPPAQSGELASAGYRLSLLNPEGKQVYSGTISAADASAAGSVSLFLPGKGLEEGAYTLTISSNGANPETDRRVFDVHFVP